MARPGGASCGHTLLGSTRRAAELCGVGASTGTIAANKVADIIAVGRNPLDDISALREVSLVIKDGEVVVDRLAEHRPAAREERLREEHRPRNSGRQGFPDGDNDPSKEG